MPTGKRKKQALPGPRSPRETKVKSASLPPRRIAIGLIADVITSFLTDDDRDALHSAEIEHKKAMEDLVRDQRLFIKGLPGIKVHSADEVKADRERDHAFRAHEREYQSGQSSLFEYQQRELKRLIEREAVLLASSNTGRRLSSEHLLVRGLVRALRQGTAAAEGRKGNQRAISSDIGADVWQGPFTIDARDNVVIAANRDRYYDVKIFEMQAVPIKPRGRPRNAKMMKIKPEIDKLSKSKKFTSKASFMRDIEHIYENKYGKLPNDGVIKTFIKDIYAYCYS